MASGGGGGVIGSMVVALLADATRLTQDIQSASAQAGEEGSRTLSEKFTGGLTKMAGAIGVAFGAQQVWGFTKDVVAASSDLNESINAVVQTYKTVPGASDAILALGEDSATAYGMSQSQFNAWSVQMSGFATVIAGVGGDVGATVDEMATRVADFASVQNLSLEEASALWQSSLAGETEAARRFGIDLSAAAVETYAYANGITKAGEDMTENEKVLARQGILMQETANYAGDFANTSDGLANSQRVATASFEDAKAMLGDHLRPAFETVMGFIVSTAIPAVEDIAAAIGDFIGWLKENQTTLENVAKVIGAVLLPAFTVLGVQALVAAGKVVLSWVMQGGAAVVNGALQVFWLTMTGVYWVKSGVQAMLGAGRQVAAWLLSKAPMLVTAGLYAITFAMMIAGWIASGVAAMAGALGMAAAWFIALGPVGWVIAAIVAVIGIFVALWLKCEGFRDFWLNLWDTIVEWVQKAWDWITEAFGKAVDFIWGLITGFVSWYIGVWKSLWDTVTGALKAAWDWITNLIRGVIDWIVNAVKTWVDNFVWQVTWLKDKAVEIFTTLVNNVKNFFTDMFNNVKDKIQGVVDFVKGLPDAIRGVISNIVEAGKDLVRGIWDGIKGMGQWLKDKVINFVKDVIPGPIKTALGISSPSKVTAKLGEEVARGLALGMKVETKTVDAASTGLAAAAVPALAGGPAVPVAGAGGVMVNVYIGEQRLTDMIRTEVRNMARQAFVVEAMGG